MKRNSIIVLSPFYKSIIYIVLAWPGSEQVVLPGTRSGVVVLANFRTPDAFQHPHHTRRPICTRTQSMRK